MSKNLRVDNFKQIQAAFPPDMLEPVQFACWKSERRPGDKKLTKTPIDPNEGYKAKTNDPTTWATFAKAARRYIERDDLAGVGFVFTENDPYAGIDLDNCRDPMTGEIAKWAKNVITRSGSYAEISPSGTGVKIYGRGKLPGHKGFHPSGGCIEMYSAGRWFAVTGEQLEGTPSEARDIQPVIDAVLAQFRAKGEYRERFDTARALAGVPEGERDETLFRLACKARRADIPEDWTERAILEAAANCEPPFDPDTALEKVHRAYRTYPAGDPEQNHSSLSPNGETLLGRRAFTDLGNAERMAAKIRGKAVYVYEGKSWYTFTGKRWEPDTTGAIYRMAAETAREIYREAADEPNEEKRNDIVKWAKLSESRVRREAMVKDAANQPDITVSATIFDTDPYILACNNGTVDLRTGELRPSKPEDYVSKLAPVDWTGLNTFAPRWQKFLEEIIPDMEIRDYLRVATGYGATGLSNARAFFICHGSGRNGKGTFLETVRDVLGDYGHTAKPETFLESRREGGAASTDVASLRGARLVVTSETKRGAKIDTNLVKSLTGDDKINARHIFERPMEFKPSWSVFVATNHKPEMPGDDPALWERVKLIPFDVRISDEDRDTTLKDKLMVEAPGVLAWIVNGAMTYLEHGLEDPPAIREATDEYQTESDPIGDFIARYVTVAPGDDRYYVSSADLRKAWIAYCEEEDVMGIEAKQIGIRLKGLYGKTLIGSKSIRLEKNQPTSRVWIGFMLNTDGDVLKDRGEEIDRMRMVM